MLRCHFLVVRDIATVTWASNSCTSVESMLPAAELRLGVGAVNASLQCRQSCCCCIPCFAETLLTSADSGHESQATRNGIRVGDLRDFEVFADKLRKLALDGASRFEGFEYDVEADIEAYRRIIPRVLPLITDTVRASGGS